MKDKLCKKNYDSLATTTFTQRELYFMVDHEENPFSQLLITRSYSKSSWYGSSFECEMTTKPSVFGDSLFTLCSWMRTTRDVSFSVRSPSDVCTCLVHLLTQTNKRQRTRLANGVYGKRRRKHFISVFCAVYPEAYKERLEKPANKQHMQPNRENIWNSSLVTKSMLISINLQTTCASLVCVAIQFWQYSWTDLNWVGFEIKETTQVE